MNNEQFVLDFLRRMGVETARTIQTKSGVMTGTELYEADDYIPNFVDAVKHENMSKREVGFVCRSSAGRVVKLLQKYDSDVYTQEPEELPAQWGFLWSTDPAKALPFIPMSTSPYMKGDCCIEENKVYRSKIDNNVHAPSAYPQGWALVSSVQKR